MKNSDLIFEKVGDISYKYSYLCVYKAVMQIMLLWKLELQMTI